MVGVPGRSKGCTTCRQRKKGCDLARPACGQCIRNNLVCGGYDRTITFVRHEAVKKGQSSSLVRHPPASSRFQQVQVSRRKDDTSNPPLDFLPDALSRIAFEAKAFDTFFEWYHPRIDTESNDSPAVKRWTQTVGQICYNDNATRYALLAVALSRMGRTYQDQDITNAAIKVYGKALLEVNHALRSSSRYLTDEVLAAVGLLALYELLLGPAPGQTLPTETPAMQAHNWMSHAQGVSRLLEVRGPARHKSDYGFGLFTNCRMGMIIAAIRSRKATYLAQPDWRTMPWEDRQKDCKDALLDIMAQLPGYLEDFDRVKSSDNIMSATRQRKKVLSEWKRLDKALQSWYNNFSAHIAAQLSTRQRPTLATDLVAEDFLNTTNDDAHSAVLYWCACLIVHSTIHLLHKDLSVRDEDYFTIDLHPRAVPLQYTSNIARCTPYFFRPEAGIVGPRNISFPLGMSLQYLHMAGKNDTLEHAMLVAAFSQINNNNLGPTVGTFLNSLQKGGTESEEFLDDLQYRKGAEAYRTRARTWYGSGAQAKKAPEDTLLRVGISRKEQQGQKQGMWTTDAIHFIDNLQPHLG